MKTIFLFAIVITLLSPLQKAFAQTETKPITAKLNHIAIYVTDLKQSTDFYHDLFNLEIGPEPFHDGKHTWFNLGNGVNLHVIQGRKTPQVFEKNEHLCFSVPSVENFVKILNNKHIKFENVAGAAGTITARVDGVKQIYFQDPDGHWLEVNDAK
ncbi:VOC family protein [Mucilaginibacter boryungensis]|uniref:VOC family protein n=1 Tax=Mucilaginibacter boryungensis TaxID=768480 RepID=A0ABR9XCS0_9SPHI|nr:VOC family protein [Mucilaginibacter boryungensis]MBE9664980.1 VOC family protein [Mucilaginibacter boryungensis]